MPPNARENETTPLLVDRNNNETNELSLRLETTKKDSKLPYGSVAQWQKILRYDPLQHRNIENPTTNLETLIHILNGNLGTGILAMPEAFKNSGLYVGLLGTLSMGVVCTHSMHILVKCAHELCCRHEVPLLSFAEVGQYAVLSGPNCLQRFSSFVKLLINCFLILMQLGFCCVYYLFVAVNIQAFLESVGIKTEVLTVLTALFVPLVALNMVRSLKYLTPTSLVASVLAISGLTIAFTFLLKDLPHSSSVAPVTSSWGTLPMYLGTAMYAFEGIGVILPLENNMKSPKDFRAWNGVLNTGMTIVVCLFAATGFYGYLKYGEETQGSVTLNLPNDDFLAEVVRLMMAVAVFTSYALQFYVPMSILGPAIQGSFQSPEAQNLAEYGTRIALIFITFILAAIIPNLGLFISLVGALSSSTLDLIFPPMIEILVFWPGRQYGRWNWILWKDLAIAGLGLVGFLVGTSTSLVQIAGEWR
ncbi:neutral amino acid uniporter 4-like [Uranotaenia lowii]|uniref:neutral amino acid uniporter 4-like n=1 Tax=Uranotaenia lowii TaxID=190385 RepID=UPI0024795FE7|nr:neutral amino acid uniporter 4-like [Uranotaenia lowii]